MSRTYRCRVQKDLSTSVRARDSITLTLGLRDLVGEEETNQILREALEALGGGSDEAGRVQLDIDGVRVTVDPAERSAELSVGEDYELQVSVDTVVDSYNYGDDEEAAQAAAEARVESQLKASLNTKRAAAEAETRERLDAAEGAVRAVLREATARTEIESLRRKAERMGRILSVTEEEDPKTGDRQVVIELELG